MTPTNKWYILTVLLSIASFAGWYFSIGVWAAYSFAQFNIVAGQGVIVAGIAVLLWEVEKKWY